MDWDHLRFFLALARSGTLVNAARQLGVDHTTVGRRIQALEKQTGAALFSRDGQGHQLTEAGRRLLPQVQQMEAAFQAIQRKSPAGQEGLSGLVRVGVPEGLGTHILAAPLACLSTQHPGLVVDLLALPRLVHLSRREADIVISLERPTRDSVVVTKLSDYHLHLFGAADYLQNHAEIMGVADLAHHTFISYVDDLLFSKQLQLLEEVVRPDCFSLRSTSVLAQKAAVKAGCGLGILPGFLVQEDADLHKVLPQDVHFTRTFWMSMPSEIRHIDRMKVVWNFLRETLRNEQEALMNGSEYNNAQPSLGR